MYLGEIGEIGPTDRVFEAPRRPYTQVVLATIPEPAADVEADREHRVGGEVPDSRTPPSGCRFRRRCPFADDRCADEVPPLYPGGAGHGIACHHVEQIAAGEKARTVPRHDDRAAE